ncbi:kinase-like protein [Mycena floridula]|nr:kinase-like protein [Mycena floridula]
MSAEIPAPTNQHFSIGPDGETMIDLTFVSEPLEVPGNEGFGYAQMEFNDAIGPDNRYLIVRKLGWGTTSSTWLARDQQTDTYVAVKTLSGYYTNLANKGRLRELEVLQKMSLPKPNPHCLQILSHFKMAGKGSAGQHLCLVSPLLGGDLRALVTTAPSGQFIPIPLVKRILLHTLRGIAHAHRSGVVHTDLKPDNIFFTASPSVNSSIATDAPRRHLPEMSKDGIVEAAVSQPLPLPTLAEAMERNFIVADFGSARLVEEIAQEEITPVILRPPRCSSGVPGTKVLIFGPMGIFEFITRKYLFKFEPHEALKLDETTHLLYQMMCFTNQVDFPAHVLQRSRKASQYFDATCQLKANLEYFYYPLEKAIMNYNVVKDLREVRAIACLMRRCLCIDPQERATAEDLLGDPWFQGVD